MRRSFQQKKNWVEDLSGKCDNSQPFSSIDICVRHSKTNPCLSVHSPACSRFYTKATRQVVERRGVLS